MNTIGSRIAYFRKQKQMTQEELAERLSVTAQAVSKWECDTSYPDILGMQALAKELGVTVDELLAEERKIPAVKEAAPEMIDRRILLIEVCTGDIKVTTRFPVSAIKKAMETDTLRNLVGEDVFEQIDAMKGMLDAGMTGPLVDVDNPDAKVCISVVDYEN